MDSRRDLARLSLACLCGDGLEIDVPAQAEPTVRASWEKVHHGAGHGPASPEALAKARHEEDLVLLRELRGVEVIAAAGLLGVFRGV